MTTLGRRIGGPNAITWPSFWMALVASLTLNLTDRYTDTSAGALPRDVLATVLAVTAMFAVMLPLRAVFLRDVAVRPRPGRTLAIFVAGSATRGLVLGLLLEAFGTGEARLGYRIAAAMVTFTAFLAITAVVVDMVRTALAGNAVLRAEAQQLQSEDAEARGRALLVQEQAVERVRHLLLERLDAMQGARDQQMGAQLRADAEAVIRPLSHDISGGVGASAPRPVAPPGRVRWADVWRAASLGRPFRPLAVAIPAMLASIPALTMYNGGLVRGVAYALVEGALMVAMLALLDRFLTPHLQRMRAVPRTATVIVGAVVGVVLACIGLALVTMATGGEAPWRVPIPLMIIGSATVLAVAIGQGFLQQVASADAQLVVGNTRLRHAAAAAQAAAWHEERRASRALHGPVQSAVISAAMRIEAGDTQGAERLLVDALRLLDHDHADVGLGVALAGLIDAWEGLCDVQVDLPAGVVERVSANPPVASAIIDVCTEACSNAVRHGGARLVAIAAHAGDDAVDVVVQDDGAPTDAPSEAGLGSAMLDDITLSWQRDREGARTVLRATLPLTSADHRPQAR